MRGAATQRYLGHIAANIRRERLKRGLTQQALAEALGLTNSAITKYEKGSQRPRPKLANRIEAFTRGEVTAASLLGVSATRPGSRSFCGRSTRR